MCIQAPPFYHEGHIAQRSIVDILLAEVNLQMQTPFREVRRLNSRTNTVLPKFKPAYL